MESILKQLGKSNQLQQSDLRCLWINNSPPYLDKQHF